MRDRFEDLVAENRGLRLTQPQSAVCVAALPVWRHPLPQSHVSEGHKESARYGW